MSPRETPKCSELRDNSESYLFLGLVLVLVLLLMLWRARAEAGGACAGAVATRPVTCFPVMLNDEDCRAKRNCCKNTRGMFEYV